MITPTAPRKPPPPLLEHARLLEQLPIHVVVVEVAALALVRVRGVGAISPADQRIVFFEP